MLETHNTNACSRWLSALWIGSRIVQALALCAVVATAIVPAAAQAPTGAVINREYAIKAAFLHQFLHYVKWPTETFAGESAPFVIGVFGTSPFGTALHQVVKDKKVEGRPIEIRALTSPSEVGKCHILFVPKSVPAPTRDAVFQAARGSHVLTVGESDDFSDRGGGAHFFLEGNKVRFAFNTKVIAEKNLEVSSKLLTLAKIVP